MSQSQDTLNGSISTLLDASGKRVSITPGSFIILKKDLPAIKEELSKAALLIMQVEDTDGTTVVAHTNGDNNKQYPIEEIAICKTTKSDVIRAVLELPEDASQPASSPVVTGESISEIGEHFEVIEDTPTEQVVLPEVARRDPRDAYRSFRSSRFTEGADALSRPAIESFSFNQDNGRGDLRSRLEDQRERRDTSSMESSPLKQLSLAAGDKALETIIHFFNTKVETGEIPAANFTVNVPGVGNLTQEQMLHVLLSSAMSKVNSTAGTKFTNKFKASLTDLAVYAIALMQLTAQKENS